MPMWLHAGLCVVVPGVWGVVMYFAFNAASRRAAEVVTRPSDSGDQPPPIDYSI